MVAMTEFHSAFIGERPEVVTLNLGSLSPCVSRRQVTYHLVFPTHFVTRISYLPPYFLLAFLYQPRPVLNFVTAVSLLLTLYKYYITDFQKSQNSENLLR